MKISVIVPVYNAERFVANCLESVLGQTYTNWELLAVDDGSKDCSLSILREYEAKDERIRVFHQENAGAGMARNNGIRRASGDYIVFVDSDDTIEKDYFERLSHKNTDLVFIDVNQRDSNNNILKCERLSIFQGKSKEDFLRGQMTGKILWGGVRKAVKTELIRNNSIYFTEHKVGEEAVYSFLLLWYAKSFSFIDVPVYNYVQNESSLSHLLLDDPWGDVADAIKEKVIELGAYSQYADTVNAFVMTAAAVSLDKMARKYSRKEYQEKAKARLQQMKKKVDKNYPIDYRHLDTKALLLSPLLNLGLSMPVYWLSAIRQMPRLTAKDG